MENETMNWVIGKFWVTDGYEVYEISKYAKICDGKYLVSYADEEKEDAKDALRTFTADDDEIFDSEETAAAYLEALQKGETENEKNARNHFKNAYKVLREKYGYKAIADCIKEVDDSFYVWDSHFSESGLQYALQCVEQGYIELPINPSKEDSADDMVYLNKIVSLCEGRVDGRDLYFVTTAKTTYCIYKDKDAKRYRALGRLKRIINRVK